MAFLWYVKKSFTIIVAIVNVAWFLDPFIMGLKKIMT